jgi:molecular chaperone GrpE (heat shock protein)
MDAFEDIHNLRNIAQQFNNEKIQKILLNVCDHVDELLSVTDSEEERQELIKELRKQMKEMIAKIALELKNRKDMLS